LLDLLRQSLGSRITVQGPKLRLKAASAQAIGLALYELATNAGKYGALSTDMGRADISWVTDGDTLTMSWTERDGPARVRAEAARVRHHSYGNDGGAQRGRYGRP
jgi:two-component sensor histidine kinase